LSHKCHARGCDVEVAPRMLMCWPHWNRVPGPLKREVWRHYREGQEIDKCPSAEYMAAQRAAIEAVARLEGREEEA
jgi:hypothetical protein